MTVRPGPYAFAAIGVESPTVIETPLVTFAVDGEFTPCARNVYTRPVFLFLVTVGLAAGALPAIRASRIHPARALGTD
jgi:hypothetical protein